MGSLTKCIEANTLMTWLTNGFHKLQIRLAKIHKLTPVGRPIIAVCDDPTARMSYFVETLLQPIAQLQQSYIRDTTAFFNFLERTKISKDSIVVSIGVSSLIVHKYTSRRRNEYSMRSILKKEKKKKSSTTISHRSQRTTSGQCLA